MSGSSASSGGAGARPPARLDLLLLVLLTLFWGFNWPVMKVAVSEFHPLVFRSFCLAAGTIGLALMARFGGHSLRPPKGALPWIAAAAFFNLTLWNVLIAYGVSLVPAGRSAILAYTMPLWGVLLSALVLGERLTPRQGAGLALGMAGLAVLMGGDLGVLASAPAGALMIVVGAASWGAGTVIVKRAKLAMPTVALAAWQLFLGGLPIYAATWAFGLGLPDALSPGPVLATLYNMLICFNLCYWIWFRMVESQPVAVVTLSTMAIPVVGVFSGAAALGERIGPQELAALALVLAALGAVLRPGRAQPQRA